MKKVKVAWLVSWAHQTYGPEVDLQVQAKYRRCNFLLKHADYDAKRLATDTRKYRGQLDYLW